MTDRSVIAYPAILHFSESRHYIREVSPANTMAYDKHFFHASHHALLILVGGSYLVQCYLEPLSDLWQYCYVGPMTVSVPPGQKNGW